jgi:hypothetical protein
MWKANRRRHAGVLRLVLTDAVHGKNWADMKPFYIFYESGPILMLLGIQGTFLQKIACYELDGKEVHSKVRMEALGRRIYKDAVWEEFKFEFETSLFKYVVVTSFVEKEGQLYLTHYRSEQHPARGLGNFFDGFVMMDPIQTEDRLHREPSNPPEIIILDSIAVLPFEEGLGKAERMGNRASRRQS